MKNYTGVSNSAHKKNVKSLGGPSNLAQVSVSNGGQQNSVMRHTSMTPDRQNNNSNQQVFVGQPSQQIKLANQKGLGQQSSEPTVKGQGGGAIPQKPKQMANSQPRGNFIQKKMTQPNSGANTAGPQQVAQQNAATASGIRGSSQQLPSNIESIQQLGTNVNNSVAVMMNARMQQPSPAAAALNNPQVNLLNQNTSIDDILAQQQNFAKNYNNSTALIGSSRKAQKIQIHMKNNRFHNRKASGPAALNANISATSNLQNKQFLIAQKQNSNVSQERISNYDQSSIQQQSSNQQFFENQSYGGNKIAVSNGANSANPNANQPTRTSSRHGRLNSGSQANNQGQTAPNNGRPSSKGMKNRKDKSNASGQQFGRTFFHPPSGVSNSGMDHSTQGGVGVGGPTTGVGPTLIDHNQILNQQFNTTAAQIKIPQQQQNQQPNNQQKPQQIGSNHVRAGTQIEMSMVDGGNSQAAIKAKQYMTRKEGSQDRSAVHFQKPQQLVPGGNTTQFDLPSGKHAKSKSQNKFSQPELARYANSIERIGQMGGGPGESSLTVQTNAGGTSNKDKRQNYSLNPQQQAQLKQTFQKSVTVGQKQANDGMLNSAYSLKATNRSKQQMKATQQISKKMLSGVQFPQSLNQTQSVRFAQGSNQNSQAGVPGHQGVPTIQNYNSNGPLTSSTQQSGMSSATQPNAHLIFTEGQQQNQHFVNTATIPMIKNGEPQHLDQMKSAYSNTQILDRLFNQNSNTSTGSNKKRSAKNQNVAGNSAVALAKGSAPTGDFMPSSATSATAFYAASKQAAQQHQSQQKFSNYQLQNLSKQKNLMIQKQSNSGVSQYASTGQNQQVDLSRLQTGSLQSIANGSKDGKGSQSVNENKGTKNSFYLKQQLQNNNRGKHSSKDRASMMKNTPMVQVEENGQQQHRKNHSVVINRAEVLRVDGKQRHVEASPDRIAQTNKALKLPGMHSDANPQHSYHNSMIVGHSNNNYSSNKFGEQTPNDYLKSLNQSATNANTRALKTKGSSSSMERQSKQGGAMTPSIERTGIHHKGKGSASINHERQSYMANQQAKKHDLSEQQYPGSSGINYPQVLNNTKQVMVTDGGTGASLKRVFIQQESTHTSQADSQSNYGSTAQHTQNYHHLPLKAAGNNSGFTNKQSKRIQMQKQNANKFHKANNSSYQVPMHASAHNAGMTSAAGAGTAIESSSEKPMTSSSATAGMKHIQNSGIVGPPEDQTITSSYKANFEQKSSMQNVTRAQQKLRTESRKDNRAISMQGNDYPPGMDPDEQSDLAQNKRTGAGRRSISINITEEALRIGKLPTEQVARNIAQNKYNEAGALRSTGSTQTISPRVIEMVNISKKIKKAFEETGEAPETNTEFYRAGKMLGRGAFGKVNLGMHKLTRKLIAIKSINQEYLTDDKQRTKIMHEVGILLRLRHESVVKLYETFETKRHIMLVMELCAGGDLLNFVRKRKKCEESLAKVLFKQIIEGIGYIHQKSILHRDIKLDNILLDGKGRVKIADFGVSKTVKRGEVMYEQSGTPAYIAPEIIKNEGYKGFKADLWSAGVVLFALLFGTVPFKANNMKDLHQQILQARYNMKEEVSAEAKSLIRGLLCTDPKKRLSVRRVLQHPWLAGTEFLNTDIFKDEEKEVIRSEFTYNDPSRFNRNERVNNEEEPWDCFTELNLDSMNQTLRNASEKSLILAPFNSTMSDVDQFFKSILSMAPMEPKKDILKFAARCRDQDRQYEINNNAELDNGVYHKFVYSTKDSKANDDEKPANKGREQEGEGALLSRNSSRQHLNNPATNDDSEDLTKARDKQQGLPKSDLQAQREALKADIMRMKGGRKGSQAQQSEQTNESQDSDEDQLANTNQSHFTVALDDDRVATLSHFGYPIDYVKYTILENEANYCVTAYYLLSIDQNY